MGSSRFPGKPMELILGTPMIGHVYKNAKKSTSVDEVYVATCDQVIFDYINSIGGKAVMTKDTHERCTERTAEAIEKIEAELGIRTEIVLMLQGDEPLVTASMIDLAMHEIRNDNSINVVNLMTTIDSPEEHNSPNEIKVVVDLNSNALYFSREPLPTNKKTTLTKPPLKQVCVIPFRRNFLDKYIAWPPSYLEIIESIDMNRVLENGEKIRMVYCSEKTYAVDIPSDILKVEDFLKKQGH